MKKYILMSLLTLFMGSQSVFADGTEGVGGGDGNEITFKEISYNIAQWIRSGNARGMQLPARLSYAQYESAMLTVLSRYNIVFTDQPIVVAGAEKTCRNFINAQGAQIECNNARFLAQSQANTDNIYRLVHHEFAGLSKVELNKGSSSDYGVSDQISQYLVYETVKRLPVQPTIREKSIYDDASLEYLPVGTRIVMKDISFEILPYKTHVLILKTPERGFGQPKIECRAILKASDKARSFNGELDLVLTEKPVREYYSQDFDFQGRIRSSAIQSFTCDVSGVVTIGFFKQALKENNGDLIFPKAKKIK